MSLVLKPNATLGYNITTGEAVCLPPDNLHTYMIGLSGTGKTSLLRLLISNRITAGHGVAVFDPHGQNDESLIDQVLSNIPQHRLQDVVLMDINSTDAVFGLHLFSCTDPPNPKAVQSTISQISNVFDRLYDVNISAKIRISMYLKNLAYLFIHNPDITVLDIADIINPSKEGEQLRQHLVAHLPSGPAYKFTRDFWLGYYKQRGYFGRDEEVAGVYNKFHEITNQLFWAIFVQKKNTVDISRVMAEQKILLIRLNADWSDVTSLIGSVLISQIKTATFTRSPSDPPFYVFIDEFQRVATRDLEQLWTEARKGRLFLTVAHQELTQLDQPIIKKAFGASTKIVFQVSHEDADRLSGIFDCSPLPGRVKYEPLKTPVQKPIEFVVKQNKGVHPLESIRTFIEQYGQALVDGAQQEEEIEKEFRQAWNRYEHDLASGTRYLAFTASPATYHFRQSLTWLNNLFYRAMLDGKEGKNPTDRTIAETDIHTFIKAMGTEGIYYLTAIDTYHLFCRHASQPYIVDFRKRMHEVTQVRALLPTQTPDGLAALYKKRDLLMQQLRRAYATYLDVEAHTLEKKPWYTTPIQKEAEITKRIRNSGTAHDPENREAAFLHYAMYQTRYRAVRNIYDVVRNLQQAIWRITQDIEAKKIQHTISIHQQTKLLEQEQTYLTEIETHRAAYEQSIYDIKTMLSIIMKDLASSPIEADSGLQREVYDEIPTSEVHNRIANQLKLMPFYTARVRSASGEAMIQTIAPQPPMSDAALQQRITLIQQQNLIDGYLRKRSDIETEMMTQQSRSNPYIVTQAVHPVPLPKARRK